MDLMEEKTAAAIGKRAVSGRQADGTPCRTLSVADIVELSRELGVRGAAVERSALAAGVLPERYARNVGTLTHAHQACLLESTVGIVGMGGLGGAVVETLARVGVGTLTVIDGDVFEDSNLNRQLLSTEKTLGMSKAQAAADRVRAINSSVAVQAHPVFLTADNAAALLEGVDVVVDCLDSVAARFTLENAARRLSIPLVTAAIAGLWGHVTTVFPGDKGLALVYGDPEKAADKGAETSLGNLPTVVMLVASLECAEAIKILTGTGTPLRNRLLVVDLTDGTFEVMRLT